MNKQEHMPLHSIVCCGLELKENEIAGPIRLPIVYANYTVIYICMICLGAMLLCRPREACSIFCLHSHEIASNSRASFDNFGRRLIFKTLEVVYEELAKLRYFFFEVRLSIPGFRRVQKLSWYIGASFWYGEIESLINLVLNFRQLARMDRVEDCPCVFQSIYSKHNLSHIRAV